MQYIRGTLALDSSVCSPSENFRVRVHQISLLNNRVGHLSVVYLDSLHLVCTDRDIVPTTTHTPRTWLAGSWQQPVSGCYCTIHTKFTGKFSAADPTYLLAKLAGGAPPHEHRQNRL